MNLNLIKTVIFFNGGNMKNGKVGFGIIGLGVISQTHYQALQNQPDCYLVGCFDVVPGRAAAWAAEHGNCKAFDKLEDMLNCPEIDAVSITTPSGFHLDPALAAINAKKHVLIEKPMEITEERIQKLIDASEKNNVLLCGIFQSRFQDATRCFKKAVEEGRFGKITLVDAQFKWFRDQAYYDSGAWRGTWAVDGGGVFMNQGIHSIDLLLFLLGKDPVEVSAFASTLTHVNIEVEDTAAAVLKFEDGSIGVIEGTTGAYPGSLKRIEICGDKGQVVLEEDSLTKWSFAEEKPEDEEIRQKYSSSTSGGGASDPKAISTIGHTREFADVASAIKNGTKPFINGKEAMRSVHLIRCIYESAKTGKPVKF